MYVCATAGAARACTRVLRVCVRVRAACMRACCVCACVLRAGQTFSLAKPLSWTYCCSKASDPVTGQLVNSGTYARVSFTPRASRILYPHCDYPYPYCDYSYPNYDYPYPYCDCPYLHAARQPDLVVRREARRPLVAAVAMREE